MSKGLTEKYFPGNIFKGKKKWSPSKDVRWPLSWSNWHVKITPYLFRFAPFLFSFLFKTVLPLPFNPFWSLASCAAPYSWLLNSRVGGGKVKSISEKWCDQQQPTVSKKKERKKWQQIKRNRRNGRILLVTSPLIRVHRSVKVVPLNSKKSRNKTQHSPPHPTFSFSNSTWNISDIDRYMYNLKIKVKWEVDNLPDVVRT